MTTQTGGSVTLSIEGNRLRLTDHTNGPGLLLVSDVPGSGVNVVSQLGLAGNWDASTIVTIPLHEAPLLPTTRLDGLFGGAGLDTSGNVLRELRIVTHSRFAFDLDLDGVDVIGGTIPEPTSIVSTSGMSCLLISRRLR
jgi:hypothetical protein